MFGVELPRGERGGGIGAVRENLSRICDRSKRFARRVIISRAKGKLVELKRERRKM